MNYRSLQECINDLEATGQIIKIEQEVDAYLEAAEIVRRVFLAGGPAIYFANVTECKFPMVGNLFGTMERARYIFRGTLRHVERLIKINSNPLIYKNKPWEYLFAVKSAFLTLPKKVSHGPVLENETTIDKLPQLVSWREEGGAFITLPQVYSEDPDHPGFFKSNLGMYRVQLSGGQYERNKEIGMHYMLHRGIAIHHKAALRKKEKFRVNIFVGGPPAMTIAATMPLPEGLPEIFLAGPLGGRRPQFIKRQGMLPIHANADFCITGYIDANKCLPEGPFGDHLGYYCNIHDFPVMKVEHVYHRNGAVWPFTVVGRPPQEDTIFGKLIHDITGPMIPVVLPGVHAVHAVDAAGVHPLMLAIGSERYTPYSKDARPKELLTQANAILGKGQMSLAKYLMIISKEDNPDISIDDIPEFLRHVLSRVDLKRDLHFQTKTTIDTLDYTGNSLHSGSKLIIAANGPIVRQLPYTIPGEITLPDGFSSPEVALPGVLIIQGTKHSGKKNQEEQTLIKFCSHFTKDNPINAFPLIVIVDDSKFTSSTLNNFLWVTFTKSDPASNIYGIGSFIENKHWGCMGSMVIDARQKAYMPAPLVVDKEIKLRVDRLAEKNGPLYKVI